MEKFYQKRKKELIEFWTPIVSNPAFSGILLVLCVIFAMLLANSPWREWYFYFIEFPVTLL